MDLQSTGTQSGFGEAGAKAMRMHSRSRGAYTAGGGFGAVGAPSNAKKQNAMYSHENSVWKNCRYNRLKQTTNICAITLVTSDKIAATGIQAFRQLYLGAMCLCTRLTLRLPTRTAVVPSMVT